MEKDWETNQAGLGSNLDFATYQVCDTGQAT